jgi:hypothetical protein
VTLLAGYAGARSRPPPEPRWRGSSPARAPAWGRWIRWRRALVFRDGRGARAALLTDVASRYGGHPAAWAPEVGERPAAAGMGTLRALAGEQDH